MTSSSFTLDARAFELALESSDLGLWDWHIASGQVSFNEHWAAIIGYTLEELMPISIQTWLGHAHPEDLALSEAALNAHFAGETKNYEVEVRMRHKEGHWVWVLDRGRVVEWDDAGKPIRMVGTHQDVSRQHQLTDASIENELRLKTLMTNLRAGILLEDANRKILLANQGLLNLFGLPGTPEDKIGLDCAMAAQFTAQQFVDPQQFLIDIDHILLNRQIVEGDELTMVDGRTLSRDFIPIDLKDKPLGLLWIYRDITNSKQREQQLRRLSETDTLTGIANRRAFMEQLQSRLNQESQQGKLFLAIVDIDHFKPINDQFGHLTGDAVLKHVTQILANNLREGDLLGRIGGEEFAIVLESDDTSTALQVLERARLSVAQHQCDCDKHQLHVTISIGLTQANLQDSLHSILARADQAMYKAKAHGRNRVEYAAELR